jgi:hypothetical protein
MGAGTADVDQVLKQFNSKASSTQKKKKRKTPQKYGRTPSAVTA